MLLVDYNRELDLIEFEFYDSKKKFLDPQAIKVDFIKLRTAR